MIWCDPQNLTDALLLRPFFIFLRLKGNEYVRKYKQYSKNFN